jgi:MFS-type transporter involved in bile tolerance (Atg22 family)
MVTYYILFAIVNELASLTANFSVGVVTNVSKVLGTGVGFVNYLFGSNTLGPVLAFFVAILTVKLIIWITTKLHLLG